MEHLTTGATGYIRTRAYKPPSYKGILDQLTVPASYFWREQAEDVSALLLSLLTKEQANTWRALWAASEPAARPWAEQHKQLTAALNAALVHPHTDPNFILELAFTADILGLDDVRARAAAATGEWVRLAADPKTYPPAIEAARKVKDRLWEMAGEIALKLDDL